MALCTGAGRGRVATLIWEPFPQGDHGFMQRTGAANDSAIHLSTPQTIAFLTAALG